MDLGLRGRRALVTGSSGGIGASIATRLAEEGAEVVVHGRRSDAVEAVVQQIVAAGARAEGVVVDLQADDGAVTLCRRASRAGPIDVLVANAGPFREDTVLGADDADWLEAFTSNVVPVLACVREVVGPMRERGWGRVVTMGARAVATPLGHMATYSAAKSSLVNATVALAHTVASDGVTANVLSPGVILTPGLRDMLLARARARGDDRPWEELEPEAVASYAPNPTGRIGRPSDVADAVAFLVSERASYVNGAVLRVDGGISPGVNP